MLGLVNALLEVYKYESGKLNLCKTTFSLKQFLQDCIAQVNALAEKKSIDITLKYEDCEDSEITADRNELRRVVLNLCGNALNHTNQGGAIEIEALNKDGDLILNVKDNGTGIPKEDLKNCSKDFHRAQARNAPPEQGSGFIFLGR